jgi:hypothetical protein
MDNSIPQKRIEKHGQLNEFFFKINKQKCDQLNATQLKNMIDELKLKESISYDNKIHLK